MKLAVEKKCTKCGALKSRLEPTKVIGRIVGWTCIDDTACRARQKKKKKNPGVAKAPKKQNTIYRTLYKQNLELKVRVAELESMLSPIVWQANRFAIAMKSALPEQTVTLTHRVAFLRKMREVLANNPPGRNKKKNWPDFAETARLTIQDLGKSLLDIGTLAEEMEIAFEAGYETRRSIELARLNGESDDFD